MSNDPSAPDRGLPTLPPRNPQGHKGTFGTVAVVGGSSADGRRMVGAPALAARAALRAGCGLARLVMPASVLDAGLTITPSATGVPLPVDAQGRIVPHAGAEVLDLVLEESSVIALGPGLGAGDAPRTLTLRALAQSERPLVVDADALNAISSVPELARDVRAPAVLTPHPGEFHRLARPLGIEARADASDAERRTGAESLAQRLGCVVVLKGARTIVSDGGRTWICDAVCDALATAGTGDVLTGVIASLIAQFVDLPPHRLIPRARSRPLDLYDAARLAVDAHARAASLWIDRRHASAGLLAHELADFLPESLRAC